MANWRWYVEAMVYWDGSVQKCAILLETLFIGVLKEKETKEKDNQYKLKKAMATPLA